MATVFSRIIDGELPARFVYSDDRCVAFLSINPLRPGHTLVVPRAEVEHWIDLESEDWRHLTEVSQRLATAIDTVYQPAKVAAMLVGLEVPHVHIHLVPINHMHDVDFATVETDPDPQMMDDAADKIRTAVDALT